MIFDEKDDLFIINEIKTSKDQSALSSAINTLVDRHSGICLDMAKKFHASGDYTDSILDIKDAIPTFIWENAVIFDPSKGMKFSTFLGERMRFKSLNSKKDRNMVNVEPYSPVLDNLVYEEDDSIIHNKVLLQIIQEEISAIKDAKYRKIMELRYLSNKSYKWREISRMVGISKQACIAANNKIIEKIRKNILTNRPDLIVSGHDNTK